MSPLLLLLAIVACSSALPFADLEGEFCAANTDIRALVELRIDTDDDDDGEALNARRKRQANLIDSDDDDGSVQGDAETVADIRLVFFQSPNLDFDGDDDDDDGDVDLAGKKLTIRNAELLPRDKRLLVSLDKDFNVLGFDEADNDDARDEYNLVPAGTICKKFLELLFKGSVALLLIMLMLGMGASTSIAEFKKIVRTKRVPFLIGFASQYLFLPAFGLALAFILDLPDGIAIGLVLVAASPGGTTSQLYTYLSNGDVALSLSMTFASTITSFGFIPLFSLLYLQPFIGNDADDGFGVVIPFGDILLALLLVLIPTAIGILIRAKSEVWGKRVEKIGAVCGVLGIVVAIILGIIIFIDVFDQEANVYAAAFILPAVGILAGYFFGWIGRQKRKHCRTISFECGLQNSSVTITIAALAFDGLLQKEVLVIPLLYSLCVFAPAVTAMLFYRWVAKFDPEDEASDDEGDEMEKAPKTTSYEDDLARTPSSPGVTQVSTSPKNFYESDDDNVEAAEPRAVIEDMSDAESADALNSDEEAAKRREMTLQRTKELDEVDNALRESL